MTRICSICKIAKELNENNFPKEPLCKDGFRPECRKCYNRIRRERYNTNEKTRNERLHHNRKWRIGVSKEIYDEQKAIQNSRCAICFKLKDSLCADHCHNTNIFRGLLCTSCNAGLGLFKDDINLLQNAIKYLSKERA